MIALLSYLKYIFAKDIARMFGVKGSILTIFHKDAIPYIGNVANCADVGNGGCREGCQSE